MRGGASTGAAAKISSGAPAMTRTENASSPPSTTSSTEARFVGGGVAHPPRDHGGCRVPGGVASPPRSRFRNSARAVRGHLVSGVLGRDRGERRRRRRPPRAFPRAVRALCRVGVEEGHARRIGRRSRGEGDGFHTRSSRFLACLAPRRRMFRYWVKPSQVERPTHSILASWKGSGSRQWCTRCGFEPPTTTEMRPSAVQLTRYLVNVSAASFGSHSPLTRCATTPSRSMHRQLLRWEPMMTRYVCSSDAAAPSRRPDQWSSRRVRAPWGLEHDGHVGRASWPRKIPTRRPRRARSPRRKATRTRRGDHEHLTGHANPARGGKHRRHRARDADYGAREPVAESDSANAGRETSAAKLFPECRDRFFQRWSSGSVDSRPSPRPRHAGVRRALNKCRRLLFTRGCDETRRARLGKSHFDAADVRRANRTSIFSSPTSTPTPTPSPPHPSLRALRPGSSASRPEPSPGPRF